MSGDDTGTRERTAPAPDAPGKPESPTDLGKAGWRFTGKAALAEFQRDQCTDLAAALTYYSVLSVFPAILALVSLLGVFGQGQATTDAGDAVQLGLFVPAAADPMAQELASLDLAHLTPIEALNLLAKWQQRLRA